VTVVIPPALRVATAAPLWRRFVAWILDGLLALAPIGIALAISTSGPRSVFMGLGFAASLLVAIGNDIVLVARDGQSIGRRLLAIKVLDSHSMSPPLVWQVIWRNIVGGAGFGFAWQPLAFLPLLVVVGPWPIICYGFAVADRRWHRGLNDRWAHTVVIDVAGERQAPTDRSA
jgi:RDD family